MRTEHTRASRLAAVATGLLAGLQLAWVMTTDQRAVVTLLMPLGLFTLLATLKMARDNCFESRLVAVVAAGLQVLGVALSTTVGLPGQPAHALDLHTTASVLAGVAVLGLVAIDRSARARRTRDGTPASYAS